VKLTTFTQAGGRGRWKRPFDFPILAERIAAELLLTEEQVCVALDYIAAHRRIVEAEYARILQRVQQRNPPHVEAGQATSPTP
jgi:hypothetical protein